MAPFKKQVAAGYQRCYAWFVDDNGLPTGSGVSAPSNGATGSAATWIRGVQEASPTIPSPDNVQVPGDDDLIAEFTFASLDSRGFEIQYAIEDLDFLATLLGVTLQNWGEARVAIMDIVNPPDRNMGFIFQSKAKKQDVGVMGQKAWGGSIVPIAQVQPLGRATFSGRTGASFRMYVTPQIAGYDPFGLTIQSALYGTSGGRYQPFTSEYPLTLHVHGGTGAVTQFTLDHKPVSVAKTAVYANRVAATVNSVATSSPYSETLSAAPAGSARVVSIYEHDGE